MQIHGYTSGGSIDATIDGQRWSIPDESTNRHRQMIAEWEAEGNTIPPYPTASFADLKAAKLAALEQKRWEVETGGMMFNGMPAPTHRDARSVVTAAYIRATEDPAYTVPNYKIAPATFVTLDSATIIAYADALETHVQAAFDRERTLADEIIVASNEAELDAIDIETGWPV